MVVARITILVLAAAAIVATTVARTMSNDRVTQTPAMAGPPAASTISGPIPVAFTLPEEARKGSVTLVLAKTGGDTSTVALADARDKGTHDVSVDPDDLAALGAVTGPKRLTDGSYSVRVRYADARGNPAVSSEMRDFTVARGTIPGP